MVVGIDKEKRVLRAQIEMRGATKTRMIMSKPIKAKVPMPKVSVFIDLSINPS